ncbi:3-dehydroquinate synthase [Alkaliphilus serpentinus]|uniref:3-dehydroquinate synthase n=1 Tax=Alkaliphilus serpentinus TaxID=1482731 RepID=A0A833HLX1_9FIRM|nr:3-dehydroquinate synthase [Alkaliphilus serpentinus]KAB3526741.1 3-dehydroquinate synthase [Alkaliphilus serpentinus]
MASLKIDLGSRSYNIYIEAGILKNLRNYIKNYEVAIITDDIVENLYGDKLVEALGDVLIPKYVIPSGEGSKNIAVVEEILQFLSDHKIPRNGGIISFGGGVVGDIAGFCSSIYMRGIDYYQIPTTLLAQVDSSVGGKTGINLPQGKNLIGSFHQPKAVIIDPDFLKTLSPSQIRSGLGEVIKYGIIDNYPFLRYIEENLNGIKNCNGKVLEEIIKTSCEIKAMIVSKDERETGLRKNLNFGHTIGHALETLTHYQQYSHGEAVLVGMFYETKIAEFLGLVSKGYSKEIYCLIRKTDIDTNINLNYEEILMATHSDKKNKDGKISFILPTNKGLVNELFFSTEILKGVLKEVLTIE